MVEALKEYKATRMPACKRLKFLEVTLLWSAVVVRFPDSICRVFGQLEPVSLELGGDQTDRPYEPPVVISVPPGKVWRQRCSAGQ